MLEHLKNRQKVTNVPYKLRYLVTFYDLQANLKYIFWSEGRLGCSYFYTVFNPMNITSIMQQHLKYITLSITLFYNPMTSVAQLKTVVIIL